LSEYVAAMNYLLAGLYIVGLLVFGSVNTLSTKLTFQMESVNILGKTEEFQKPWFGSYRMFQGMAVVIVLHLGNELRNFVARRRLGQDAYVKLGDECPLDQVPPPAPLKGYFLVMVPSALDLLGTTCTYIGLFYNTPSVFQMFRGAMIIFATFFSVVVLKRKLSKLKWIGVGMCVFAITFVGVSNILSADPDEGKAVDPSLKLFGMGMILLGMFIQGGQIVAEEMLMKGVSIPPLMIVGMEGVWGCVLMLAIIFPIVGALPGDDVGGVVENLENDIFMLKHSKELQQVVVVYLVSVFTYNIAGMMVTYSLSAVHRTMLEASRTVVIWAVDLILHAVNPKYGEVWSMWSYLQLGGFVLLILGQMTYSEWLTWGLRLPPAKVEAQLSPVFEPGFSPFSPVSPDRSPTALVSPTGKLDLPIDLPDEFDDVEITGLDEPATK